LIFIQGVGKKREPRNYKVGALANASGQECSFFLVSEGNSCFQLLGLERLQKEDHLPA